MKLDRQGRDDEPSKPAPRWVRIVLWLAVLALFIPAFFGCAQVVVYERDGVTYHRNNLAPCERGASGCTVWQGGKVSVYYSDLHPSTLEHERAHAVGGMKHTPWRDESGEPCAVVTASGGGWVAGQTMCRRRNGDFYRKG